MYTYLRNIAALGEATQSSHSEWSLSENEAQNFLTGYNQDGYAFHTSEEDKPYIIVDLKNIYPIYALKIFPRLYCSNIHCPALTIYTSTDGVEYKAYYSGENIFSQSGVSEFTVVLYNKHVRFIMLESIKCTFSLRQMEILVNDQIMRFKNINIIKSEYQSLSIFKQLEAETYEKREIEIALETISEQDIVLELGANVGVMACMVSKNCKPLKYYAVEANPVIIESIHYNVELNNVENISVINTIMTSGDEQKVSFYIARNILSSALSLNYYEEVVVVNCLKFNDFLFLNRPTYIICDIECGEYSLFTKETLLDSVRKICIELHPTSKNSLESFFEIMKFHGFLYEDRDYNHTKLNILLFYK